MFLAVAAGLVVYSSGRLSADESTPQQPGPAKVWNVLELRILVLVSLCLQTILICFGNRRKYKANTKLQFFIWLTYLSADWIATVALGILSKDTITIDPNITIMAIWAPFLLVHLGGPDTITAYSLEDNELWPRHFLGLLYQLAVAVYVVYRSWNGSPVNYVTVPILFAGIIKYGERTWSLWSASSKCFRDSILPPPDPGPNYAKFMDDYTAKKAEGYNISLGKVIEITTSTSTIDDPPIILDASFSSLRDGFKFYKIPRCLFADLILSFQDHTSSQIFFQRTDWKHAFEVIAVELGLMYDILYTKAPLTYSRRGIFLKLVSLLCTLSSLIAFSFLRNKGHLNNHHLLNKVPVVKDCDQIITFVLFGGAIFVEIYAIMVLISSNWALFWMGNYMMINNWRLGDLLYKIISKLQSCLKNSQMWSNCMSQFNLIRFSLKNEPITCIDLQKFLRIYELFENSYYQKKIDVHPELKKLIFGQLWEKSQEATDIGACKKLCARKGDRVLEKSNCDVPEINRSIKEVEFDQSILLWHIATDLLYYSSSDPPLPSNGLQSRETSRMVSDYMLNLLVTRPFLLPNGIGQMIFEDTCAEIDELLKERKYISESNQVCRMILRVNTEIPPSDVKGDRSKSVLFDACRLAKSLQSLKREDGQPWTQEEKWKMIGEVWVEMLCHAASQCRGLQHAKQLSDGGELLTHVWLLMAHLGITEQFQISQGHARAKLKLS